MIDIIAGIITGSNSCNDDCSLDDMSSSLCSGNFLLAFKIESMIDYDIYLEKVEELKNKIKNSPKAKGVSELFLAGGIEYLNEETSRREGVKVSRGTWDKVKSIIG